jgi:hypothetical protein
MTFFAPFFALQPMQHLATFLCNASPAWRKIAAHTISGGKPGFIIAIWLTRNSGFGNLV